MHVNTNKLKKVTTKSRFLAKEAKEMGKVSARGADMPLTRGRESPTGLAMMRTRAMNFHSFSKAAKWMKTSSFSSSCHANIVPISTSLPSRGSMQQFSWTLRTSVCTFDAALYHQLGKSRVAVALKLSWHHRTLIMDGRNLETGYGCTYWNIPLYMTREFEYYYYLT